MSLTFLDLPKGPAHEINIIYVQWDNGQARDHFPTSSLFQYLLTRPSATVGLRDTKVRQDCRQDWRTLRPGRIGGH